MRRCEDLGTDIFANFATATALRAPPTESRICPADVSRSESSPSPTDVETVDDVVDGTDEEDELGGETVEELDIELEEDDAIDDVEEEELDDSTGSEEDEEGVVTGVTVQPDRTDGVRPFNDAPGQPVRPAT